MTGSGNGMHTKRSVFLGIAVAAMLISPGARAGTVDLFIDSRFGSTENTGATALVSLGFSEEDLDDYLTVLLENTTPVEIGSKLTAVGFELPDFLDLAIAISEQVKGRGRGLEMGPYFDTLTFDHSVSPGWLDAPGGFDLMITSDGNYQGGNPNGAPNAGESQSVILNLGDTGLTIDELENGFRDFYAAVENHVAIARFQAVGPDGEGSDKVGGHLPEPATIVLLAFGAFAIHRRR